VKQTLSCTTIVVGAKASSTGSPMTTHTSDCLDCDFRVNKAPARDWEPGSVRNIHLSYESYPRLVATDRGPTWHPDNLEDLPFRDQWATQEKIVGTIPQVNHTYALIEGQYGMMNENQVAIGESSTGAILVQPSIATGGTALMATGELTSIALERSKTAREAILIIGGLAEEYGFYGPVYDGTFWSHLEAGDALTIIDKHEAWIFHICPDDTGTNAVWVAQRLPDDAMTVIANQFIIKEVDPDSEDFLYSPNLWDVAHRTGLYKEGPNGLLHFSETYRWTWKDSPHYTYASRRMWNVFRLAKPSLQLTPYPDEALNAYPTWIVPDFPIDPKFILDVHRDYYFGTEFDMRQGVSAGPYQNPERFDFNASFDGSTDAIDWTLGFWERPIPMYRTSTTLFATPRKHLPDKVGAVMWLSQYNPANSVFAPLYVASSELPSIYTRGSLFKYTEDAFFWMAARVGDHVRGFYMWMAPYVKAAQDALEDGMLAEQESIDLAAVELLANSSEDDAISYLTDYTNSNAQKVYDTWYDLFEHLMTRWHDGFQFDITAPTIVPHKLFYHKEWLSLVGYFAALEEEKKREAICLDPEVADCNEEYPEEPILDLPFQMNPFGTFNTVLYNKVADVGAVGVSRNASPAFYFVAALCFTVFGIVIDRRYLRESKRKRRKGYTNLEEVQEEKIVELNSRRRDYTEIKDDKDDDDHFA